MAERQWRVRCNRCTGDDFFPVQISDSDLRIERVDTTHTAGRRKRVDLTDNSPLTVAYEDAVLRAEGLASDRLGDVMDFFNLTEHQAHTAFCSCHMGNSFEARLAARRVRALMTTATRQRSRLRAIFAALLGL